MNFWDKITGNDMNRELAGFDKRVQQLPPDYRTAWQTVLATVMARSDFSGRNLMPILSGILELMEAAAARGASAQDALGEDVAEFADGVGAASGATSLQDRWRAQLNAAVYRKLGRKQP
ncbi:DUF1048 domain-containing protein [Lacticaseibacillus kribbianus]|uniref:DUF1048 domain-containing protein n=1 Tax=Lacticaseibacillus kribbianus TaxID=2926292 RepID=UPI001CD74F0D|nr:DUF1048 domain-containing protein [Lacticaseibacillus kribbianus]